MEKRTKLAKKVADYTFMYMIKYGAEVFEMNWNDDALLCVHDWVLS